MFLCALERSALGYAPTSHEVSGLGCKVCESVARYPLGPQMNPKPG